MEMDTEWGAGGGENKERANKVIRNRERKIGHGINHDTTAVQPLPYTRIQTSIRPENCRVLLVVLKALINRHTAPPRGKDGVA